jgi:hypothetical protein
MQYILITIVFFLVVVSIVLCIIVLIYVATIVPFSEGIATST